SCGVHTMELYRRLPHGWRPGPQGVPTDQHMWRQILAMPGVRCRSGFRPTVVHPASADRESVPLEDRIRELDLWFDRSRAPDFRERFLLELVADAAVRIERLQAEQKADREELAIRRHKWWARLLINHDWLRHQVERVLGPGAPP